MSYCLILSVWSDLRHLKNSGLSDRAEGKTKGRGDLWVVSPPPQHQQKFDSLYPQLSPWCTFISQPCLPVLLLSGGASWYIHCCLLHMCFQSSMALHCIHLLPEISWDIPALPTGGPNLTRCSPPFTRLWTCCVNHPRLGAGKSSPPSSADSCTTSSMVLHRST